MKTLLTLLIYLIIMPIAAAPNCEHNTDIQNFFDQLEGSWSGKAVTTPVGPRPYDISFERKDTSWIYGQANPGAAIHHWGFYCDGGRLWLRFLSTFRGNRSPTLLKALTTSDKEFHFKAIDPSFLEVSIMPGATQSMIKVLHHGELHVQIILNRLEP